MNAILRRLATSIPVPLAFVAGRYVETQPAIGWPLALLAGVIDVIGYWVWTSRPGDDA